MVSIVQVLGHQCTHWVHLGLVKPLKGSRKGPALPQALHRGGAEGMAGEFLPLLCSWEWRQWSPPPPRQVSVRWDGAFVAPALLQQEQAAGEAAGGSFGNKQGNPLPVPHEAWWSVVDPRVWDMLFSNRELGKSGVYWWDREPELQQTVVTYWGGRNRLRIICSRQQPAERSKQTFFFFSFSSYCKTSLGGHCKYITIWIQLLGVLLSWIHYMNKTTGTRKSTKAGL